MRPHDSLFEDIFKRMDPDIESFGVSTERRERTDDPRHSTINSETRLSSFHRLRINLLLAILS